MKTNLLPWWPLLTPKERHESEGYGVHPLSERQRAIETLRDASRLYRAASPWRARRRRTFNCSFNTIADKLQGSPYALPAGKQDALEVDGRRLDPGTSRANKRVTSMRTPLE
jgi:hypothetical protein